MVSNSLGTLSSSGSIADARWADPDDIFNRYAYEDGDIWLGRNPHNGDQAIGYKSDKHVIVCAGSRSGKGRSFIINNLALWTGSTVVYDPKGELPEILAARRGDGDEYCEGMEQDVFVLDPLNHSNVDPKYLAYFDPLAGLDPNDGELPTWASRIASALIKAPQGTESEQWAKKAAGYIALVIMHVLTFHEFSEDERTLNNVLRLVRSGEYEVANERNRKVKEEIKAAKVEGRDPTLTKEDYANPYEIMFAEMIQNRGCRGHISDEARSMLQLMKEGSRTFESIRSEAADQLRWLKSAGIEKCLTGIDEIDNEGNPIYLPADRRLNPDRLKTDPKGISVFIVMPVEDLETYEPWLQVVFVGLFAAMRKTKGMPKTGKQVLTILDEFSSLGYQDYIIKSLDSISGSGMKLITVVQNFGRLKELYKDSMESFLSNSSLEIYFGKIGETASEYLKKQLGETEVVKIARSSNRSENESETTGQSITFGESDSKGESESNTSGTSTSNSWNWNRSVNYSDSKNWGQSDGRNMGRNYGPHVFLQPFEGGSSRGTSLSHNSGNSHTKSASKAKGGGKSYTTNKSQTKGSSWNHSTNKSETQNVSSTKGYQIGSGTAESFHKKPLLDFHEFNRYLQPFSDDDRDHIGYPGFMLVRMEGENATFLRRCNYDQDIVFERCFSPDPSYKFLPHNQQELLGYQYTDEHIWEIKIPAELRSYNYDREVLLRKSQKFEIGQELFCINDKIAIAPVAGRVLDIVADDHYSDTGSIVTIRSNLPATNTIRQNFEREVFGQLIDKHHSESIRLREEEARRQENARKEAEVEERRRLKHLHNQQRISDVTRKIILNIGLGIFSTVLSAFVVFGILDTIRVSIHRTIVEAYGKEANELASNYPRIPSDISEAGIMNLRTKLVYIKSEMSWYKSETRRNFCKNVRENLRTGQGVTQFTADFVRDCDSWDGEYKELNKSYGQLSQKITLNEKTLTDQSANFAKKIQQIKSKHLSGMYQYLDMLTLGCNILIFIMISSIFWAIWKFFSGKHRPLKRKLLQLNGSIA